MGMNKCCNAENFTDKGMEALNPFSNACIGKCKICGTILLGTLKGGDIVIDTSKPIDRNISVVRDKWYFYPIEDEAIIRLFNTFSFALNFYVQYNGHALILVKRLLQEILATYKNAGSVGKRNLLFENLLKIIASNHRSNMAFLSFNDRRKTEKHIGDLLLFFQKDLLTKIEKDDMTFEERLISISFSNIKLGDNSLPHYVMDCLLDSDLSALNQAQSYLWDGRETGIKDVDNYLAKFDMNPNAKIKIVHHFIASIIEVRVGAKGLYTGDCNCCSNSLKKYKAKHIFPVVSNLPIITTKQSPVEDVYDDSVYDDFKNTSIIYESILTNKNINIIRAMHDNIVKELMLRYNMNELSGIKYKSLNEQLKDAKDALATATVKSDCEEVKMALKKPNTALYIVEGRSIYNDDNKNKTLKKEDWEQYANKREAFIASILTKEKDDKIMKKSCDADIKWSYIPILKISNASEIPIRFLGTCRKCSDIIMVYADELGHMHGKHNVSNRRIIKELLKAGMSSSIKHDGAIEQSKKVILEFVRNNPDRRNETFKNLLIEVKASTNKMGRKCGLMLCQLLLKNVADKIAKQADPLKFTEYFLTNLTLGWLEEDIVTMDVKLHWPIEDIINHVQNELLLNVISSNTHVNFEEIGIHELENVKVKCRVRAMAIIRQTLEDDLYTEKYLISPID